MKRMLTVLLCLLLCGCGNQDTQENFPPKDTLMNETAPETIIETEPETIIETEPETIIETEPEPESETIPEEEITHPHIEVDPAKALLGVDYFAHPPFVIQFRSPDELREFMDSPNLPDEEFTTYVDRTNYYMNRLQTKEDAQCIIDYILSFRYPVIPGTECYYSEITLHDSEFYLNYGATENGELQKRYSVFMKKIWPDEDPAAEYADQEPLLLKDGAGQAYFCGSYENGVGETVSRYLIIAGDTQYIVQAWNITQNDLAELVKTITFVDADTHIAGKE
ncbi:MAG: hypothetical protein IJF78_04815 [Clostridia bacterium]|nr:hypothetical protein [Clostridia bacterium]